MSAISDTTTDWQREVLDLKRQGMTSAQIAEAVGKHAATVRKVIARAKEEPEPIEGQTTVEEQIEQSDRIVWTGENWPEFRKFLGRPSTAPLISYNFEFMATGDRIVRAEPGDTVIRTGENTYEVEKPEDPLHAFKAEAGEAVGDMPKQPEPDPQGYDVRLKGTRQMALDFGAEELPVGGTLKLKSDKLASGFYGLGDVITGTFTARVVDVAGAERFQRASEEFRVQPQGHVALITEIKLS